MKGVKDLKIKIKSSIIISMVILSGLIINLNFDLNTIGSENDSNPIRDVGPKRFGGEDLNWSQIEVISEPILSQNNNINGSLNPKIAVEGDKIYVVWADVTDYNGAGSDMDIFYRFFDGSSWSKIEVISEPVPGKNFNTDISMCPEIAVESGRIYVVWCDGNNTNGAGLDWDIFYRCNLTGSSWEDIQVISEPIVGSNINTVMSFVPKIAIENGKIYVVWCDGNNTNGAGLDWDIFYRCNLTGNNWEDVQVISEPLAGALHLNSHLTLKYRG